MNKQTVKHCHCHEAEASCFSCKPSHRMFLWKNVSWRRYLIKTHNLCAHQVHEAAHHLSLLQVGLSVQRSRLDVTQPVWIAGAQQQHVSRNDLITAQPDEISHTDLLPVLFHITALGSGEQRYTRGLHAGSRHHCTNQEWENTETISVSFE